MASLHSSRLNYQFNGKKEEPVLSYKETVTNENGGTTRVTNAARVRTGESGWRNSAFNAGSGDFGEDYEKFKARFFSKFGDTGGLPSGCLYSSTLRRNEAKGADIVDGGASARPAARLEFERKQSERPSVTPFATLPKDRSYLVPKTIPFGHVGGSSRRGYTLNKKTYEQIRDDCFRSGRLFEDPDFPATDRVIFPSQRYGNRRFEWKRPGELSKTPEFILDGAKRFDIVQGELGNCWLLAAVADLTLNKTLLERVVPHDQGFSKADKYCGIFHFRFWQYGQWVDVVIDDRLPTVDGRLVFMQSRDTSEFWTALLEKAYAKVSGTYENLRGGNASEAMEDFTGGLAENYTLQKSPDNLFVIIQKSFELGAMMSCSIDAANSSQMEHKLANGLVMGHAYSVTNVALIDVVTPKPGKVPALRLRNPWGGAEWRGAFSDGAPEWKFVPNHVRSKLEVVFAEDGEFWIPYDDVLRNFTKFEICNLGPETMVSADGSFAKKHQYTWEANVFSGSWTRGVSAGGCRNFESTFHLNPQYRVALSEADGPDGLATCVVALMQKERRKLRSHGKDLLTIGYAIYRINFPGYLVSSPCPQKLFVPEKSSMKPDSETSRGLQTLVVSPLKYQTHVSETFSDAERTGEWNFGDNGAWTIKDRKTTPTPLNTQFFLHNASMARSPSFVNSRQVTTRFRLPPGDYIIIPSTFEPHEEGDFLLRVYSEVPVAMREHDHSPAEMTETPVPQKPPVITKADKDDQLELIRLFNEIAGIGEEIGVNELASLLRKGIKTHFDFKGFSPEIVRSMMTMSDVDFSGKLGLDEFTALWETIKQWKDNFARYDLKGTGKIHLENLREAMETAGYLVNNRVLRVIAMRYGQPDRTIDFEDFMLCIVRLRRMINIFRSKDELGLNSAIFSFDDWMLNTMYT